MTTPPVVGCVRCGRPLDNRFPPPTLPLAGVSLAFRLDARPSALHQVHFRALTDRCAACLYDAERTRAEQTIARLGVASPGYDWALRTIAADAFGGEWQDYSALVFGALLGV